MEELDLLTLSRRRHKLALLFLFCYGRGVLLNIFANTRWEEEYLRLLALQENSFVAEYRLDPMSFDVLLEIIRPCIEVSEDHSLRPFGTCGSKAITSSSLLAAALIILGGGRCIEAMRTHGLSKSFVVTNLMKVVDGCNQLPP
jgi:hypothetical protein